MRRKIRSTLIAVIAGAILAGVASVGTAQVFYSYPGAPIIQGQNAASGATIAFGDNDLFRLLGYLRFNISDVSDFGVELVLDNSDLGPNDDWRFGGAVDFKYLIIPKDSDLPFDLAFNAGFGFQTGNDVDNINIPVGGLISRPLELNNGRLVVPYGGVYVIIQRVSWDGVPGVPRSGGSDTDADVELRAGAVLHLNDNVGFGAGFHIGAEDIFMLGFHVGL